MSKCKNCEHEIELCEKSASDNTQVWRHHRWMLIDIFSMLCEYSKICRQENCSCSNPEHKAKKEEAKRKKTGRKENRNGSNGL